MKPESVYINIHFHALDSLKHNPNHQDHSSRYIFKKTYSTKRVKLMDNCKSKVSKPDQCLAPILPGYFTTFIVFCTASLGSAQVAQSK